MIAVAGIVILLVIGECADIVIKPVAEHVIVELLRRRIAVFIGEGQQFVFRSFEPQLVINCSIEPCKSVMGRVGQGIVLQCGAQAVGIGYLLTGLPLIIAK